MASICFDKWRNLIGWYRAGFSRIAHGQYAIFISLRGFDESGDLNNQKKGLKVVQNHQNEEKQPKYGKRV